MKARQAHSAAARLRIALVLCAAVAAGPVRAAGDATAADSAGVGWRTSAGVVRSPVSDSRSAPGLQFHAAALRARWRDVAFVAGVAGACVIVGAHDVDFTRRLTAHDSQALRDLARYAKPFGQEIVVGSAVLAWVGASLTHRDALLTRVERADLSIAAAGACTFALKEIVGRDRPEQSPGNAGSFEPFSNHDSFPSGHTTLAFAAAAALDRETSSRWVPVVAYPLAGLVGWSRLHDQKHWSSDVLAGAAIGFGVTWKAEDVMRPQPGQAIGQRVDLEVGAPGTLAALRVRW